MTNKPGIPWIDELGQELDGKFIPNKYTEIGKKFENAMVPWHEDSWLGSPRELHSELMTGRKNFVDLYEKTAKEYNMSPIRTHREDAIRRLQNPNMEDINWLIEGASLDRFFKPDTPLETKANLIKMLPVGIGALSIPGFINDSK